MYTRSEMLRYVGRIIRFRVINNPHTYRGFLTQCDDSHLTISRGFEPVFTCPYAVIQDDSLIVE